MATGPTVKMETITPAKAAKILEEQEALQNINRRVDMMRVERYAADMKKGQWQDETTETIKFNPDGMLRDGQHRLAAVVMAGKDARFFVARGVPDVALKVVDTGRPKTFADVLHMGGSKHARQIAAIAKLVYHYDQGTMLTSGRAVSHPVMDQTVRKHRAAIDAAVEAIYENSDLRPQAVLGAVFVAAYEKYPKQAESFFSDLNDRVASGRTSPVARLNQRLGAPKGSGAKSQLRAPYVAAVTIKAFNAYRKRQDLQEPLNWESTGKNAEEFPVIS